MIKWLLSGSVLIAVVLFLRAVLGSRLPARLRCWLWLLVLIRLLVPVSLGQSALSPANLVREEPSGQLYLLPIYRGQAEKTGVVREEVTGELVDTHSLGYVVENADGTVTRYAEQVMAGSWVRPVWIAGSCLLAGWFALCNGLFYRRLRKSRRFLRNRGKIKIYQADVPSGCVFGLFPPAVYVTERAVGEPERLRYVAAHELTHIRRLDPLWNLLRTVCLVIWWPNPLVWAAAICSRLDGELACDAATLAKLGSSHRLAYGRTLVELAGGERSAAAFCAASTLSGGCGLRNRIRAVATRQPVRRWAVAMAVLLMLLAVLCAFSGGRDLPVPADQPQADSKPTGQQTIMGPAALDPETDSMPDASEPETIAELAARYLENSADTDAVRQLETRRDETVTYVFRYLLDRPGCLDGVEWTDTGEASRLFRLAYDMLGGAMMPLETMTQGEWWEEYQSLALRNFPDLDSERPEGDLGVCWDLARMVRAMPKSEGVTKQETESE